MKASSNAGFFCFKADVFSNDLKVGPKKKSYMSMNINSEKPN